ncbi:Long-chain-fatty-acid--CoA ligase ACSBG2 [Myotis davidii]|uniref:long-chain-fatty-acid--CoA ligase n=1 Tax=Myotis davidii TaxID=225400 RepID=L5LTQ3_MYODS|nr:Long-chain-fatty-acid--CoA ligase ACSBG2 [Myotis davidii]
MSKHGPGHEAPVTIPEYFRESVNRFGTYSALASKKCGKWEVLTYNHYFEACRKAAKALLKLGLERFHGVGILGFNSVEWVIASVGTILAGGLCVGIYATNSADACQYVIAQAKVNVLMVENDLQLQKILSIPPNKLGTLKAIVQYKMPMNESNKSNLYSWDDFMDLGNTVPDPQLDHIIASQKVNQCAVLIYTSGTMGNPKGVMLSHDNITWLAGTVAKDLKLTCASEKQEVVVSYLPLSHIAALMMDIWLPMKVGGCTYFAQPDALKLRNRTDSVVPPLRFPSSCGKIASGCKNMLLQPTSDGIGEVCMWGRHVFMGYLEKQEETTEIIDEEGWLHSGDLGFMDNQGFLYITGRIKEMLITAGGENVAPVPIENRVKERIPIVSNALLVGDKANFLSILLTLKCETDETTGEPLDKLNWEATKFCQDLGSQASTVSEIVELQDPLVYSAIQKGIDDVNQEATSNAQKIQKWVILEKDFSFYGGELGRASHSLCFSLAKKLAFNQAGTFLACTAADSSSTRAGPPQGHPGFLPQPPQARP